MKYIVLFLILFGLTFAPAQKLSLKKGAVEESIAVDGQGKETLSLYLPQTFEASIKQPVLLVMNTKKEQRQVLRMLASIAEDHGYVLMAPNSTNDSLNTTENILVANRALVRLESFIAIDPDRLYTVGLGKGGHLASVLPLFIKEVDGVISCGASMTNVELLDSKKPFHYIGITGREDYAYLDMFTAEDIFNKMKFPNQVMVFDGGKQWPPIPYLQRSTQLLDMAAMSKGILPKDTLMIRENYNNYLSEIDILIKKGKRVPSRRITKSNDFRT